MHEVAVILVAARRRLAAVRTVESAALAALAAALGALGAVAGWTLAYRWPVAGLVLCAAPAAGAAGVFLPGLATRWRISAVQRGLMAGVLLACVAASVAGVSTGLYLQLPRAAWLINILLAGVLGSLVGLVVRPSIATVAMLLDERLGLHERLATSADLLACQRDDAMAKAVYDQSSAAARATGVERASLWSRGRGTAGALALTTLACLTLLLFPAYGPGPLVVSFDNLASQTPDMTPDQMQRLANELRHTAQDNPSAGRLIQEAADAAQAGDKELLAQSLRDLARLIEAGKIVLVKVPDTIQEGTLPYSPGTDADTVAAGNETGNYPASTPADTVDPARTEVVFHRDYANLANAPGNAAVRSTQAQSGYMSFDAAWDKARAQASQSLSNGHVPPKYRPLVREFFKVE